MATKENIINGKLNKCCICPAGTAARQLEKFRPQPVMQCNQCGLVYINAKPDQHEFVADAAGQIDNNQNEKNVEYWGFPQMYQKYQDIFDGYFAERLERLKQYQPKIRKVLDIGCGFGLFMKYLTNNGIKTCGFDIDGESIKYASNTLGLNVEHNSFKQYHANHQNKRVDAIVACDVLEHIAEPIEFLDQCRQMIGTDGLLYIQVPNVLGDVMPTGGSFNWPYHIWQFTPKTLQKLLENNGFDVLEWWTGVMGVIGVYQAGGPDEKTKKMWRQAKNEKRGNRLQMLARPKK